MRILTDIITLPKYNKYENQALFHISLRKTDLKMHFRSGPIDPVIN